MKIRSVCSAAATLVLAASAFAQPACTSLGTLANPSTTTGTVTIPVGGNAGTQWLCFTLAAPVDRALGQWMDIDTNGAGTGNPADTEIGLYDSLGNMIANNDDSGPGLFSMLSFGATTPTRPGLAFVAPATSAGSTHAGGNGALVPAGNYYLAIATFNATFGATAWTVTTTGTATGNVAYRIDIGAPTSPTNPTCTLALAPTSGLRGASFVATCTVTPGLNPSSTGISVSLNAANVDGGTVALLDDGVAPDAVAGDNIFTGNVTVGAAAAFGAQTLTSTVLDAQARTSTCTSTFTVLAPPPANDECGGAFVATTGVNPYDTNGATTSTVNGAACSVGTDVWFMWDSGPGGQTTISTCTFTTVDTGLAVYANCGDTTSLICNDDSCGLQSSLTFCSAPATTYFIRVGDFAGGNPHVGNFLIDQVPGSGSPTIAAGATPTCGTEGTAVTITASLTNAGCPAQTVTGMTADASIIGGGSVTLTDDGVAPDVTAGDGTWTGATAYGAGAASGSIAVTANLSGGGTALASVAMTVPGSGSDEAGDSLATAAVLSGGSITSISGVINSTPDQCTATGNDVDMYKFQICDPANFSASTVGGTTLDTQLFIFNANGFGVVVDDDCPAGTLQSCIGNSIIGTLPVANYYLAISTYNQDPHDSSGQLIWANTPFNVERAPDGPGAANALASWDTGAGSTGAYTISLTGVCGAAPECHGECVADFDDGSGTGVPDGGVTIDDLLYYLGLFEAGTICADVDDGSGTGTQDGGVTIDDLLYYLFRFEAGC